MTQHPVAAERVRCISLFLSILYLTAVHLQGREDDTGVSRFINYWPNKFWIWPTCLHNHLWRWSLWEVCWWRPLDTSVHHCTYFRGGFSLQTPKLSDHLDQWATFFPGDQGLHFDINPAILTPHKLSLHLSRTYSPHAVTLPSLTNLGPVTRLEWHVSLPLGLRKGYML
jgi:hypothetical protein